MTTRNLVFPPGVWDRCQDALFGPSGDEGFAMGLARPCRRPDRTDYVVENLVGHSGLSYSHRNGAGLTLSRPDSNRLNTVSAGAAKLGLVPVHLHSHPPGVSTFSDYDDSHELQLHRWLREQGQPFL